MPGWARGSVASRPGGAAVSLRSEIAARADDAASERLARRLAYGMNEDTVFGCIDACSSAAASATGAPECLGDVFVARETADGEMGRAGRRGPAGKAGGKGRGSAWKGGRSRGRGGALVHDDDDYSAALQLQQEMDAELQAADVAAALTSGMLVGSMRSDDRIPALVRPALDSTARVDVAPQEPAELAALEAAVVAAPEDEDASLALAIALQEEEMRAYRAAGTVPASSSGKVRVVARGLAGAAMPAPMAARRHILSADDADCAPARGTQRVTEDAREVADREEEARYRALRGRAAAPTLRANASNTSDVSDPAADGATGTGSPVVDADEDPAQGVITKHDADLCGRRAARQLEREFGHITGDLGGVSLSAPATSTLRRYLQRQMTKGTATHGRVEASEHATVESVLDSRTRMILFKLVQSGRLDAIAGVCRVGKEAAVYRGVGWHEDVHRALAEEGWYGQNNQVWEEPEFEEGDEDEEEEAAGEEATTGDAVAAASAPASTRANPAPQEEPQVDADEDEEDEPVEEDDMVAIKIHKLTLNEFRDRYSYMEGDRRFAKMKLSRHNPRRVVTLWATKEFQNLIRIHRAGIPSPAPLALRGHVLVMGFIGADGWPAPQLRDAPIKSVRLWTDAYAQVVAIMNALYKWTHLVHADLSEHNLLYDDERCVHVIDVGQAVDVSHPMAEEFLRRDVTVVSHFFAGKGVAVLPVDELVRMVKDESVMPHPPEADGGYRTGSHGAHPPAPGSGLREHKAEMAEAAVSRAYDSLEAAAVARGVRVAASGRDVAPEPQPHAADGDISPFDGTHGPVRAWIDARLAALAV